MILPLLFITFTLIHCQPDHLKSYGKESLTSSNDLRLIGEVRRYLRPTGFSEVISSPFTKAPTSSQHVEALMKACEIDLLIDLHRKMGPSTLLLDMQDEKRVFRYSLENCFKSCHQKHPRQPKQRISDLQNLDPESLRKKRSDMVSSMMRNFYFLEIDKNVMAELVADSDLKAIEQALNYNQEVVNDGSITEDRWKWAMMASVQQGKPSVFEFLLSDKTFDPRFDNDVLVKRMLPQLLERKELFTSSPHPLEMLLDHDSFDKIGDQALVTEIMEKVFESDSGYLFATLSRDSRFIIPGLMDTEIDGRFDYEIWLEKAVRSSKPEILSFLVRKARVPVTKDVWNLARSLGDSKVLDILAPAINANPDTTTSVNGGGNSNETTFNPYDDNIPSTFPRDENHNHHSDSPIVQESKGTSQFITFDGIVKGLPFLISFILVC